MNEEFLVESAKWKVRNEESQINTSSYHQITI